MIRIYIVNVSTEKILKYKCISGYYITVYTIIDLKRLDM